MGKMDTYIPPARGVFPYNINLGNSVVVGPDDDLAAKYNWLKSSDRDSEMGVLAYDNERVLLLSPGQYDMGNSSLAMDTSFVNLVGVGGVVITANAHVTVVNKTAFCASLKNIKIVYVRNDTLGTEVGLKLSDAKIETGITLVQSGNDCTLNVTDIGKDIIGGIGAYNDGEIYPPDEILIYDSSGTRVWYEIKDVADNDNITIKDCTAADFSSPDCAVVSMHSFYANCEFIAEGSMSGASSTFYGRPVWSALHMGGVWHNCQASDMAWRTANGMDCHPIMYNCKAGTQSFGGDNEGTVNGVGELSGKFYFCESADMGFGGCTIYAMNCSSESEFWFCQTYSRGFAMGKEFNGKAYFCGGEGDKLFGGSMIEANKGSIGATAMLEGCWAGIDTNTFGYNTWDAARDIDSSAIILNCRSGNHKIFSKTIGIIHLPLSVGGGTADIAVITGGSSIRFDVDGETAHISVPAPPDWDGISDFEVVLFVQNAITETVNDYVSFDVRVLGRGDNEFGSDYGVITNLLFQETIGQQIINKIHKITGTVVYDDGNYPIETGDIMQIKLTANLGNGGVPECTGPLHVISWYLKYNKLFSD